MASLFLLASLSILAFSLCCHADYIADICSQSPTISPTTCSRILRSDPRSSGAYIGTLGQIAIKKAKVAVRNTATVAKSVSNLNNTGAVDVCMRACSSAFDDLNTISKTLKSWNKGRIIVTNKGEVAITLYAAVANVDTCDHTFAANVGGELDEVKEAITIARGLIIVVLIITRMF